MKILLLAPQPFYQERGTPIAVHLLLQTLSAHGHQVDVLTYHEGCDRVYPGVRLLRIPRLPGLSGIGPGPSLKKVLCDVPFAVMALWLACRHRYDVVHAVEESALIAIVIRWCTGTPYLYDMDSGLADQVLGKFPALGFAARALRGLEAVAVRRAEIVIPVCDALAELASTAGAKRIEVLRDISMLGQTGNGHAPRQPFRSAFGIAGPVAMYVGNLEWYQGIDLLLEGMAQLRRRRPDVQLVIVGGEPKAIERYRQQAKTLGLHEGVWFVGPWPLTDLGYCLDAADVLVSPRRQGGNTPMKIYSYLDSGKPVLATDLPTHTQVLTPEVAVLAAATPRAIADGLVRLFSDAALRQRLGQQARRLVAERYSYRVFDATLSGIYASLAASPREGRR